MAQSKTVVILGASMAGVPTARKLLEQVAPKVPGLKVILVAPNTHFFWNLASVRGVLPDRTMPDEKLFYAIAPAFAQFDSSQFEFVVGKAIKLDPEVKNIQVAVGGNGGGHVHERTISYDLAVVATGSSAKEKMPWKIVEDTETTKQSLETLRKGIENAQSILVAGGGMTGIEVAGELGQAYNGKKDITLVVDGDLPLTDSVRSDIRVQIVSELELLGVKVLTGSRVVSVTDDGSTGGKTLELVSKPQGTSKTIQADVYLPTFGVEPNTDFLPLHMLDGTSRVKTTNGLRAEGQDDIYVVGDASNIQSSQAAHVDGQVNHILKDLTARLVSGVDSPQEYKSDDRPRFAVTIGSKRGTGQMGTMKLPSIAVWWVKGRHLLTNKVPEYLKA